MKAIKSFKEFIAESVWGDIRNRVNDNGVRTEDVKIDTYTINISITALSPCLSGGSDYYDLSNSKKKEVKAEYKNIQENIRKDIPELEGMRINTKFTADNVEISNVASEEILFIVKKIVKDWIDTTLYVSDVEGLLPMDDLEMDDVYDELEDYLYANVEH